MSEIYPTDALRASCLLNSGSFSEHIRHELREVQASIYNIISHHSTPMTKKALTAINNAMTLLLRFDGEMNANVFANDIAFVSLHIAYMTLHAHEGMRLSATAVRLDRLVGQIILASCRHDQKVNELSAEDMRAAIVEQINDAIN